MLQGFLKVFPFKSTCITQTRMHTVKIYKSTNYTKVDCVLMGAYDSVLFVSFALLLFLDVNVNAASVSIQTHRHTHIIHTPAEQRPLGCSPSADVRGKEQMKCDSRGEQGRALLLHDGLLSRLHWQPAPWSDNHS